MPVTLLVLLTLLYGDTIVYSKGHVEIWSQNYLSSKWLIPQGFGVFVLIATFSIFIFPKFCKQTFLLQWSRAPHSLPDNSELLPLLILPKFLAPSSCYPKSQFYIRSSSRDTDSWKYPQAHMSPLVPCTWECLQFLCIWLFTIILFTLVSQQKVVGSRYSSTSHPHPPTYSRSQLLWASLSSLFIRQWWSLFHPFFVVSKIIYMKFLIYHNFSVNVSFIFPF